ncbi:HIT family protein [Pseudomonas maumuensis]|uniref:HIT family protein n=1 Tax=Pseudomonas maumuensis TaxID=2842354 RepID=UPI003F5955CC
MALTANVTPGADMCIFCDIGCGHEPAHIFWQSETHMAFLSIFPNTPGVTVVIPKRHYCSYAFDQDDHVLAGLMVAAKEVARLLDSALKDVGRTAMVLEGYGIDHLHAKLFPLHGTGESSAFRTISSDRHDYFDRYEGYVSSHDCRRADDRQLASLAWRLAKAGGNGGTGKSIKTS